MNIGMNIKLKRIEKGIKQYKLAEGVGVTSQYIRLIEKNIATNPSKEVMEKIAKELDSTVGKLFFEEY